MRGLYQALAVAAMCLQEQAATRPLIGDVVTALTYLASQIYDPNSPAAQNNKVSGQSTPRHREGLEEPGRGSHHGSPSTHKYSPDFRRVETGGGGSGRRWGGLDESEGPDSRRDSPVGASRGRETPRNRDLDRERAVAAAKVWGENWRGDRKRTNGVGSFDGTYE